MSKRDALVEEFRVLHHTGCFVIPNPWDAAGARMMAALGFRALATTSSGYAFSQGRKDGCNDIQLAETLAYASGIVRATDLPVTVDLEDCYATDASGIDDVVRQAAEAGLAGFSIEDRWPNGPSPIREYDDALRRVEAAVAAARTYNIVLTARADGLGKKAYGLDEAIRRLQAFEAAGADVLHAPGVADLASLRHICASVSKPVNHVIGQGLSGVSKDEIAAAGVRRISLGGSLARAMGNALMAACQDIAGGDFSRLEKGADWAALRNPAKLPNL